MTDDVQPRRETLRRQREEMQEALDGAIEDTIRSEWLKNTVAWIAVVAGSFLINLLLLVAVTGR
jgi:hypothetical protein